MIVINYLAAAGVFSLGLLAVLLHRDLIKIVLGLSLMESSCYLLLVSMAYRRHGTAPVLSGPPSGQTPQSLVNAQVTDPVLQNFCLTAIVIGVAVTAVFLTIAVRAAQHYRSVDADELTALHG
ncbi:MAG TPA: sodium:proton antiporter [Jatrophihabitans sp.]|nr:sodium:proton antiporter [Jatrophihabitans sp.]